MDAFDPYHLTPHASLNRLRIVDLPGVVLDPDVRGKTAYDLLAAGNIANSILLRANELDLASTARRDAATVIPMLSRRLTADDARVRAAARDVARSLGRSLAYILLTLLRGDEINRRARDDWDPSYWQYWSGIRALWIGGGIVSGQLGPLLRAHAAEALAENGADDIEIHLAAFPSVLPLIGAARSVRPDIQASLVFDFGTSLVKRGYAVYRKGMLAHLRVLPPLPVLPVEPADPNTAPAEQALAIAHFMIDALARTWAESLDCGNHTAQALVVSLASYVRNGQPLPRPGGMYSHLHTLLPNCEVWLADRLSQRLGTTLELRLIHDGTAAARTFAGEKHAAAIMMGTALGVGFPPPAHTVLPLAADWTVTTQ